MVVTERLIVNAYGRIRGPGEHLEREPTEMKALKNLAGIAVTLKPGEAHGDGVTSKHHGVRLTFTDGSTFELPNTEWFTERGAERMEKLLPKLYAALS
ncbi:hypothetical protein PJ267_16820 [Arthrobacter sp. OVS8]|nr:hypothetical protein PJ267_16820 [Arthrobacter sp. OVS8]